MSDYIEWVMACNPRYLRVEFLNDSYEREIYEVQRDYVQKGYMVRECRCNEGKPTIEFYKADGASDYIVQTRDECEPCKEVKE